ncbi:MAG: thiamine pyrophosphate-binding protein, partial [Alphaproteobacteria bacterium]
YLATKKIAAVLTTSGPGILNTLPIFAEAFTSRIPLILISGLAPSHLEGNGAFQDTSGIGGTIDISQMVKQCSSFYIKIKNPNEIPAALENALASSMKNKRPSVILIPKDMFNQQISKFTFGAGSYLAPQTCPLELINAINFCRQFARNGIGRPLIILGEELVHQLSLVQLKEFIKKTSAAVALTAASKGLFDHTNPLFLGLIGIMGHREVDEYLEGTDHIILVGSNLEMIHRHGIEKEFSTKHILNIKTEKSSTLYTPIGKSVCEIYGDIEKIFSSINESIPYNLYSSPTKMPLPNKSSDDFSMANIISEIQNNLEDDANLFIDAGNSGAFVIHHLETTGKGTCYVSLGMGGMGNSIGAGIGSSAASAKKSYVFLGDGSFLIHGLEIHTALEYNLPVTFFIFNNNSHGMCSTRESIFMGGQTGINNFRESHLAKGFESIFPGIIAHEVNDLIGLKESLADIKDKNSPCIVSINISNSESPPFKTFNKTQEVQNDRLE